MPECRPPRGAPFLTVWHWLIAAAAVGATALFWLEVQEPQADSGVSRGGVAEDDPVAAAFDNLRTVEAIARTGPEGVPDLVDALANSNFRFRRNALHALRLMGPEAVEALLPIRERLADEDAQVRSFAISAYWHIRRDPDDVAAMLGDHEANVREAAAQVLKSIGPPALGPVVELLRSGAPAARGPALAVLRRIGWDASRPQIDDVVREQIGGPDVHAEALRTLATWGHPTSSEISELLQLTDAADGMRNDPRSEPGSCEAALCAIIRQGPGAAENLDDVINILLEDRRGEQQWNLALAALRAMQTAARSAAPRLLQYMNDIHDVRRIDVGWTLLAIGADPQDIVHNTAPFLLDKDTDTCFHAGRLCASASPDEARRQVSRLIPLLDPEKLTDSLSALDAVWGLAPEAQAAIPALSRLLECDREPVARIAAKTLGDIGPAAAAAIPNLLAQLARGREAHDDGARSAFCEALGKMGPAASNAIPALLAELNDAPLSPLPVHDRNRIGRPPVDEVLSALIRIGNSSPAVLAAIRRHLANESEHLQLAALWAVARLTPDSRVVVAGYVKWLRDSRTSQNRVGVILAIGRLPGDRKDAVDWLSDLLAEGDPEIRKAVAWSLGKIGPDAIAALPALREVLKDWKGSLYSFQNWRTPRLTSTADNPRTQLERQRWIDLEDHLVSGVRDLPFSEKSVQQVVREAITAIEAGSKSTAGSSH